MSLIPVFFIGLSCIVECLVFLHASGVHMLTIIRVGVHDCV